MTLTGELNPAVTFYTTLNSPVLTGETNGEFNPFDFNKINTELENAKTSEVKEKTFDSLDARFEETESDVKALVADVDVALATKADKSALTETNLRIATINKSLSDYRNAIASINVNQSPKQTTSGYGTVSLPVNAANGQISVSVKGNTLTNYADNGVDYANWVVATSGSVVNSEGVDLQGIGSGTPSTTLPITLKTSTQYTLFYEVVTSNVSTAFQFSAGSSVLDGDNITLPHTIGQQRVLFTTKSAITDNQLRLVLRNNTPLGQYVKFKNVMVIEGDYTAMPHHFIPYGTNSTISAGRIVSANEDETERTEMYIPDVGVLRSGGLFNLADNGEDYENWTVGSDITKSVNGLRFAGNFPPPGAANRLATLVVGFKPSTTYTIVFNVTEVLGVKSLRIGNNLTGNEIDLVTPITSPGLQKIVLTTASTLTDSNLNLLFSGLNNVVIAVALYGIYEGDWSDNPYITIYDEITGGQFIQRIDDDGIPLSEAITTPVAVSGTLIGYPNGTVYVEPVLPVAGVYTASGIEVTDTDFPIDTLERIAKIDFMTGVETEVDVSQAVIAGDGLSFTHADLIDGDIVFFTYYHAVEGTQPEIDVEYYDSRYTVKDSETEQFYRWKVTVANGVPSLEIEVV